MAAHSRLLLATIVAFGFLSLTGAAPWPAASKHSTRRLKTIGRRGLQLEVFHPETAYETYGDGLEQPSSFTGGGLDKMTLSFVQSQLSVDSAKLAFNSGYMAGATQYAYVKQMHNGIAFANAVANVAFQNNKVVAFGHSFVNTDKIASSEPSIDLESVISRVEDDLDGKINNHPPVLEYLVRPDGSVSLVHVVQIQNEDTGTWFEAFIDAHTGDLVSVTDFVADASYKVLPLSKETLPEGEEILTDPQDLASSPLGWHDDGTTQTNVTAGNNVVAFKAAQSSTTLDTSAPLNFVYTYDDTVSPTDGQNVDASRVNAFYIINSIHDIAYKYGFTEASFNFQNNNFGKGGKQGDRVLMSVQDASGLNNANFATPPDGQSGTCRMFVWTLTNPRRDGAVENDIISHEMTHGITNRMTGGGTGRCLQTTESGGMGEGWSDAMAEWTEHKSGEIIDYVLGQYVTNNPAGIRTHPYSTNPSINPLRYSSIAALNEVHNIGEVWANMLHNVYAALVKAHGFSATAKTDPTGTEGNIVFLHLFIDALALQPCNPTFVNARDAWIQADVNRYNGANACLIWEAFASRGLGVGAKNFVDATLLPPNCVD